MNLYLNPFSIFGLQVPAPGVDLDPKSLALLNGYVETVLAAPHDPALLRTGYRLSKAEIRRLLSELNDTQQRHHHLKIQADRSLLSFLEYGHPSYLERPAAEWDLYPSDFRAFILPYFQHQWKELWQEAEQKQQSELMERLLAYSHLLPQIGLEVSKPRVMPRQSQNWLEEEEEEAVLDNRLLQTIQNLRQLGAKEDLYYLSERELLSYLSDQDIKQFNQAETHPTGRNRLAKEGLRLIQILLEEHGRRDGADALFRQLSKLQLDARMKQHLEEFKEHYAIGKSSIPLWVSIGLGVVLLLFVLKYLETTFFP
jgi:hypothetical protein